MSNIAELESRKASQDQELVRELEAEFQKTSRESYLHSISVASRKGLQRLPTAHALARLAPQTRDLVDQINLILADGLKANEWSDEKIVSYAKEIAWVKLAIWHANQAARDNNPNGPVLHPGENAPDTTTATRCEMEYDQCMAEHSCTRDGWFCGCCIPCSVQYMACWRHIFGATGIS